MTDQRTNGLTDGFTWVGARDTCVSKNGGHFLFGKNAKPGGWGGGPGGGFGKRPDFFRIFFLTLCHSFASPLSVLHQPYISHIAVLYQSYAEAPVTKVFHRQGGNAYRTGFAVLD